MFLVDLGPLTSKTNISVRIKTLLPIKKQLVFTQEDQRKYMLQNFPKCNDRNTCKAEVIENCCLTQDADRNLLMRENWKLS